MKSRDSRFITKKRRGLSSIVGALIFVVLMVATFAVLGVALDSQTDIVGVSRDVADTGLKKQQENFVINNIVQNNLEFLQVNVTNQGPNLSEIFTMVITNSSDNVDGFPTNTYDIPHDTALLPPFGDLPTDIVKTSNLKLDITADDIDESYDIKLISSLGNIQTYHIVCKNFTCGLSPVSGGTGDLDIQLLLDGATGVNTKGTTVLMFVTNTGDATITNVTPFNDCTNILSGSPPPPIDFTGCILESPDPVDLQPGQTALFKWDGTVTGNVDDVLVFCNTASGDSIPPPVQECDTLTIIDPNDCGGCEGGGDEDILDEKFITRPELFLTIPSPFGDAGTVNPAGETPRALWGANVVNPTDTTMFIHKITITAFAPSSPSSVNIFMTSPSKPLECDPQDISPGNGTIPGTQAQEAGFWSCPGYNTLMWKNYADPIELPPQSTFPFLVKLQSSVGENVNVESVLVDSTVFTTSGSFGKGNYQSTYFNQGLYANVFETTNPLDPVNSDFISTVRNGIMSGSVQKFHIVLTDFDPSDLTFINATSKIVVNVPRAFKDVKVIGAETTQPEILVIGTTEPTVVVHPDKTTQIIATITDRIGDGTPEFVILTFEATAPDVTETKLMVMYTLANGEGTGGISVGPLSEIVLQVVPP